MCGIGGIVSDKAIPRERLLRIASTLQHRGPDDSGIWSDEDAGVGFAHTRLSIVDLSPSGHQPMISASGRYVIIFNGEIYNHRAIRRELEEAGAATAWRGQSDTETLLEAIGHWGLHAALGRATGMFAIALFDRRARKLFLARDRFGEKPLYYGWIGGEFLFGSELKALLEGAPARPEISSDAVREFADHGYIRAPRSIYRNIYKLQPGCIFEASTDGLGHDACTTAPEAPYRSTAFKIDRYWDYAEVVTSGRQHQITNRQDALEQLEDALSAAVRGQSVADVPIGAFLSGGIDSSLVVALYQRFCSTTPRTFTIGFENARFNEADDARSIAKHLGTEHHELILTPSALRDSLVGLPTMYDEPFADSSQIPTHLVSRLARRDAKVALSGDGGDELFGGYNRHILAADTWGRTRGWPLPLRKAIGTVGSAIPADAWNVLAGLRAGRKMWESFGVKVKLALQSLGGAHNLQEYYQSISSSTRRFDLLSLEYGAVAPPGQSLREISGNPAVNMMYWDAISYLPGDLLCKVDRASMATSLEVRVPLLDHRVADVAARIPIEMKIGGGVGKIILRDLLHKTFPKELFQRPKAGFAVPLGDWLRNKLKPWAGDLLDPAALEADGHFNTASIRRMWDAHTAGVAISPSLCGQS